MFVIFFLIKHISSKIVAVRMTYGVKSGADLRDLIHGIVLTFLHFIISIVLIVYIKIDICTQEK